MFRAIVCFVGFGMLALPSVQALEYSDDFQTASTYDTAALFGCFAGSPTKYTFIELVSADIFNEWAVSGGGQFKISNSAINSSTGLVAGLEGRLGIGVVGWMGLGIGCPGEPSTLQSNVQFTNDLVCMYGGYSFNMFQLSHAKFSSSDARMVEYGPDGLPGKGGVDDDGDGTIDNGPLANVDDDADGTTDEQDEIWDIQSPEYLGSGPDGQPGFAGVDDDGINGIDDQGELGWPGADGKFGVPGVDDDLDGTVDNRSELGWPGSDDSDDSDDTIGEWGFAIGMHATMVQTKFPFMNVDPRSPNNQFTLREISLALGGLLPGPDADEIPPRFYNPFTNYNYVFCGSRTCYGAMMWVERDMANPSETIGPWLNTRHTTTTGECALSAWHINNGAYAALENTTLQGNGNFSETFWIVEGDVTLADFAGGKFGYPSPSADLDNDRDVDVNDFLTFSGCFAGSIVPPAPGCQNGQADLDDDGDVDVNDFLTFSSCFAGSLTRPNDACFPPNLSTLGTACFPPVNDTCYGATDLGTIAATPVTVTDEIGLSGTIWLIPTCDVDAPDTGNDVWFKFKTDTSPTVTISTCDATGLSAPIGDNMLAVYSNCSGTQVHCQDADNCVGSDREEVVGLGVTPGVTYYIQVTGEDLDDFGKFNLTVSVP